MATAYRQTEAPAQQIDIDALYAAADQAGPDSVLGFVGLHHPFTVYEPAPWEY
ncbi:MAG: hypothetical protein ACRC5A_00065 [Enterobacteriaceae bacterium]